MLFIQPAVSTPEAYLGWFTDADISNSSRIDAPVGAPSPISGGTIGKCIDLSAKPIALDVPVTDLQKHGAISFWLKPNWDGKAQKNGTNHKLLKIGDPAANGLQIEANNQTGLLRFIMAGKNGTETKITAVRTDISSWKSGDWHHVMVGWLDLDNAPLGLAIWIDKNPVISTAFGGTQFMNPAEMSDSKVYIGHPASNAIMDEIIIRNSFNAADCRGGTPIAYRDYFRTAPYTAIQITHAPQRVNSDKRVVLEHNKQFGLLATRIANASTGTMVTEDVINFDGPEGSTWDGFDAKPYIKWSIDDTSKASVDANGLVNGVTVTSIPATLTARFRGMTATYPVNVITWDQPDINLMYVERTPRYRRGKGYVKVWPDVDEKVTSIIHYGNFGYKASPAFKIKFELIPDLNRNFAVDPNEANDPKVIKKTFDITGLAAGQTGTVEVQWTWPSYPVFVRVVADPNNHVNEICEANNQRCDLNTARAVRWGFGINDNQFIDDWKAKTMNLVGSFSDFDWCQANVERLSIMLRESVCSTTTPNGILDSARVDNFITFKDYFIDHEDPRGSFYDGGYEEMWDSRMTLSPGNIHEMGHNVIGLPDLYGHGIFAKNILLKDENGTHYGGTPMLPSVNRIREAPWSSATWGYPDGLGIGYTPLMVNNHLWMDEFSAGIVQKYAGKRAGLGDYADLFGRMVPSKNSLQIFDVNDEPLKNARVYIYQCANTGYVYMPNKYYADRPKFVITDNGTGIYTIPTSTYGTWDDWDTDGVEGEVSCPTPFDRGAKGEVISSGIHWQAGEMLLLKIVSNGRTEFQTIPLTDMVIEYFRGNTGSTAYPIRTSLVSSKTAPNIMVSGVPEAIKKQNLRPIARVNGEPEGTTNLQMKVKRGQILTFDGSESYDSEGQTLHYRWDGPGGPSYEAVRTIDTSKLEPREYEVKFHVIDGVRFSDVFVVTLFVE